MSDEELDTLWVFMAAHESGYLQPSVAVSWAEQRIARLAEPPLWMLHLYEMEDASYALGAFDTSSIEAVDSRLSYEFLYFGFLYLRWENGDLNMDRLLMDAGAWADAHNRKIDCSTFYMLHNEIDGGGPTQENPLNRSLSERVSEAFAPMTDLARQQLWRLTPVKTEEATP